MSSYEELMKTLLKEAIEKEKLEERETQSKASSPSDKDLVAIKDVPNAQKSTSEEFFDIDRIINLFSSATETHESSVAHSGKVSDAYDVLRNAVGASPSDIVSFESLGKYIEKMYKGGEQALQGDCNSLPQIARKNIILNVFSNIMNNFNDKSAGFVNEQFMANLIGGRTIPPGDSAEGTKYTKDERKHKKISEEVAKYFESKSIKFLYRDSLEKQGENMADLETSDKKMGISLKTKTNKIGGSFRNLCATLGISYISGGKGDYLYHFEKPVYDTFGIFIYQKKDNKSITIHTAKISRDEVIKFLEANYDKRENVTIAKIEDNEISGEINIGTVFDLSQIKSKAQTKGASVFLDLEDYQDLTTNRVPNPEGSVENPQNDPNYADTVTEEIILNEEVEQSAEKLISDAGLDKTDSYSVNIISDYSPDQVQASAIKELSSDFRQTLNDLNTYFGTIHTAIVSYALDPTAANARLMIKTLENNMSIEKIALTCDEPSDQPIQEQTLIDIIREMTENELKDIDFE